MPENGQDKVFIKIYDETYNNLCKYVVLKCGNAVDVPDIVQNTYMLFYRALTKKHKIEKPKEYLFKIAKNEINKFYAVKEKRLREVPVFSDNLDDEQVATMDLEELLAAEFAADRNIELSDVWSYIEQQDALTIKIFVLYFRFDEKITDISKELNISESNVKNRLYRTIKRIQKEFDINTNDN